MTWPDDVNKHRTTLRYAEREEVRMTTNQTFTALVLSITALGPAWGASPPPARGTASAQRASVASRPLPASVHESFAAFWKGLPADKAANLESNLRQIQTRAREGQNVSSEVAGVGRQYPELQKLSEGLNRAALAAAGADGAASCRGIGWIGRDGKKVQCSGALEVPEAALSRTGAKPAGGPQSVAAPSGPQGYCIGASSCDTQIKGCLAKHNEGGHFECHFSCSPWDGCCIGSCD
jgi:hypothetical protein